MRTHSRAALFVALAATTATPVLAAPPPGLTHQRTIYSDEAETALRSPEGVACDDRGALVIADTGNSRLLTFTWKDGVLSGGAEVKLAQLPHPVRVQIDSRGFVYALDRRFRRIARVDAKGEFAGFVEAKGASSPVTPAAFKIDRKDNLLVLDVVAAKVVVLSADGRVTRELPLPKGARGVTDVAADSGGRVYVLDAVTAVVFVAEPGGNGFQPLTSSMKDALSFPTYLAPDDRGRIYIVDQNGNAIAKVAADGSFQGRQLAIGWTDGFLYYPAQVCINAEGEVFVADRNNHRVQIFTSPR